MDKNNSFRKLPVCLAITAALYQGSAFAEEQDVEVIEVTGIRSSLTESMEQKKEAQSIQDSIVAEDIGKFPDQNVAESLQRITGVAIDRNNGEGSKITVRGMGPQFNTVDVNNRTIATTDRGREFDFQTLPSELISGAEVIKASRANIKEGSLGAYVNINTARPLDKPGFQAAGSFNARYNDLAEEFDPKISAVVSNTFADDSVGILFGVSHLKISNRIDSAATNRWDTITASKLADGEVVTDTSGNIVDTTDLAVWTPGRGIFSIDTETRERTSANTTLQWAPADDFVTTIDFLYSELSRQAERSGIQVPLQGAGWKNLVVSDNMTMVSGTRTQTPIDGLPNEIGQDSKTYALGFNAVYFANDWTYNFDVGYSKAESEPRLNEMTFQYGNNSYDQSLNDDIFHPDYIDGQIKSLTAQDYINIDNSDKIMSIDSTIDYSDPASARSWWIGIGHNELEDEVIDAKLDATWEYEGDFVTSIEMGVSYFDREKSDQRFQIAQGCRNDTLWTPLPNPAAEGADPNQAYINANTLQAYNTCQRHDLPDDLFLANNLDYLSQESGDFPRDFLLMKSMDDFKAAYGAIRNEPNWTDEFIRPTASVSNTEETVALYTQINLEGEAESFDWSGNLGLRYVNTETSSTGYGKEVLNVQVDSVTEDQGTIVEILYGPEEPLTKGIEYDHFLPSFNFSLDFGEGYYVKAAGAKVITRPAIEDTGVNSNSPDFVRTTQYFTSGNNPFLEPYEANQFDLSFEYYAENGDAYSLGFFYKDISTFISQKTVSKSTGYEFAEPNGDVLPFNEIRTEPTNRKGGEVKGFEAAALHYFDYLPGVLGGFGIQTNYTYTSTEDKEALNDENVRPNVASAGSGLEGFSENAFNFIGFYDKDAFQARLAYNWRDGYLKHRSNGRLNGLPHHVDDYGQWDFSTSYDVTENVTLSAEVINLTDADIFEYADIKERMVLVQYTGRRYQVGVTAKF